MVNTTRASLCSQVAELKHFEIITGEQESEMIDKINAWDIRTKLLKEIKK